MNTEKQNLIQDFTIKGQLIAVLTDELSFREVSDIINHKDAYEWLFVTNSGKTVYRNDVLKLPSNEFPVKVIDTRLELTNKQI